MMIPQIAKALSRGFSANQVIKFLLRKFPNHKDAIEKALAAGFTADQVIRYLSRGSGQELEEPTKPAVITEYAQMRDIDRARREQQEKAVMAGMGALAGAPMALNALRAAGAPTQAMAMQHAMPSNPATLLGNTPQKLLPTLPQQQPPPSPIGPSPAPIQPMAPAGGAGIMTQPPVSPQAITPQRDIKKSVGLIKNIGEEARIKNLIDGGLPPKDIAGVLRKLVSKDKLQALESVEGGLEAAIEDYAQSIVPQETKDLTEAIPTSEEMPPEIVPETEVAKEDLNLPEEAIEPSKPIQKNETVVSPHGIGQVKEIRNGRAIVEVDGKKHQVDEADLEKPEYSEDEIADAYDDLMAKIPEPERSSFISWAGYDEDRRVLGYIPRGGKYEELTDITPEEAELIKHGKGVARTTGENREGYHIMGGDTRGLISQIQHDRRKKRETESKKQLTLFEAPKPEKQDRGMKPIFDEMAFARGLSRERDRKKAEEARAKKKAEKESEKARIKREKDEAKKRKKQA